MYYTCTIHLCITGSSVHVYIIICLYMYVSCNSVSERGIVLKFVNASLLTSIYTCMYMYNLCTHTHTQEKQQQQSWLEERRKQREDEKRAREEVRAKLAQDRLERQAASSRTDAASRTNNRTEAASRTNSRTEGTSRTNNRTDGASRTNSRTNSSVCRIQLKLPAGRSEVLELSPSDTLGELRSRIAEVGICYYCMGYKLIHLHILC